ncbi:hypothetical protein CFP71_42750 [Amycolatopsis thailandensis]|uniref:Uncharacterized protein n=1 Tax=Amycolatopsis thailandensis TaxID=589330 RepID=A0A229R3V7_9PSEU|nr:hypothetical protein [Amycolatopsis thailandensis]OXM41306.1 hypothetical protein CFP71_42750 [Amycolatopsis thailandensis]
MTTTVVAPANAHLSIANGPVETCSNPECNLELSRTEKARSVRQNGLCNGCVADGVTAPELPAAPEAAALPAPAEETIAPEAITEAAPVEETAEETAARLHSLGLDPETCEPYRCGHCNTSIAATPDAEYCTPACEAAAVSAKALEIAVDVVRFAYPEISAYEAETGLTSAVKHWSNGRVAGQGIAAAARAWNHDYKDMKFAEQGQANTKALPILKAAIRAAQEFAKAHRPA